MMREMEHREHPTDEALARWVDTRIGSEEGSVESTAPLAAHLSACAPCRDRVAALQEVVAALRAEEPLPDPAVLAASRARILAAIAERTATPAAGPRARAWRWFPAATAAAAVLATVLLLRTQGETGRETLPPPPIAQRAAVGDTSALEVVAAAEAAADAAGELDAGVAILDPAADPMPDMATVDPDLVEEFAALAPTDQEAVLAELQAADFEL